MEFLYVKVLQQNAIKRIPAPMKLPVCKFEYYNPPPGRGAEYCD